MNKYTSAQTANLLGVSRRTLERWRTSGKFVPEFKTLGGHSRYSEEQINQIIHSSCFEQINEGIYLVNKDQKKKVFGKPENININNLL